MLTSFLDARKTWVVVQHAEGSLPVGKLVDFVINPETGRFEALWIRTVNGLKLLVLDDVVRWKASEIVISDENDLTDPDEFPRLQKILEKEVPILESRVFLGKTKKKFLGRVQNFVFDTISPRILNLHITKGFWIFGSERIISRSRIEKITKEGIFVSETSGKVKVLEKKSVVEEEKIPEPEMD